MSRHGMPATFALLDWQGDVTGKGPFLDLQRLTGSSAAHGPLPLYVILTEALESRP